MRIATFNIENLDEDTTDANGEVKRPTLADRFEVLVPQLKRLNADIICFQEVHGQETDDQPRQLLTLGQLLDRTPYHGYEVAHTKTTNNEAYNERNLVVASRFPITETRQLRNDRLPDLLYRTVTASPPDEAASPIRWERPILHCTIDCNGDTLHVINLHLKSRIPSNVPGQKETSYSFKTVAGWAEGYFISSMKRVGQALETRLLVDELFENDPDAKIIVCGDFNAEPGEVPVETIVGRVENTGNPALGFRQLLPCSNTVSSDSRYTHLHEGHGNLLDHMVISRSLMACYRSAEIHNEGLHDESISFATDKKYPESDHAPFIVEFDL